MTREEQIDLPFQRHSETSREAAESMLGSASTLRAKVYRAIAGAGEEGLTDLEIEVSLRMLGSTARPRRIELVNLGLVQDSGRTRQTPSGRSAVVWIKSRWGGGGQ